MENDNILNEKNELDRDLWELEKTQSGRRRFESILKLYSMVGFVTAICGISYFVLITLGINLNYQQQLALIISGVGIALSSASWSLLIVKRERLNDEMKQLKSMHELSDFLRKWSEFEEVSKSILYRSGQNFNRHSIREVIEILLENKVIGASDVLALDEAIQARNMAVHGGTNLPKVLISKYSKNLTNVIAKILKEQRF